MGEMGEWWNPFGCYESSHFFTSLDDEPPPTVWQRLVGRVFSNRPTYVIVNDADGYFCGYKTIWSHNYDGEAYPTGRREVWLKDPAGAVVYETLSGARRRLKRLEPWCQMAVVAAIREKEELVIECEEWLEPTSPTAAISMGASTEIATARS